MSVGREAEDVVEEALASEDEQEVDDEEDLDPLHGRTCKALCAPPPITSSASAIKKLVTFQLLRYCTRIVHKSSKGAKDLLEPAWHYWLQPLQGCVDLHIGQTLKLPSRVRMVRSAPRQQVPQGMEPTRSSIAQTRHKLQVLETCILTEELLTERGRQEQAKWTRMGHGHTEHPSKEATPPLRLMTHTSG